MSGLAAVTDFRVLTRKGLVKIHPALALQPPRSVVFRGITITIYFFYIYYQDAFFLLILLSASRL
jgi:hypothetical protein